LVALAFDLLLLIFPAWLLNEPFHSSFHSVASHILVVNLAIPYVWRQFLRAYPQFIRKAIF